MIDTEEKRDALLSVKVTPSVKSTLVSIAKKKGVDLSSVVTMAVIDYINSYEVAEKMIDSMKCNPETAVNTFVQLLAPFVNALPDGE